ncbi:MAG TPA: S41 family peptidase [Dehalococcoidia bacterium]
MRARWLAGLSLLLAVLFVSLGAVLEAPRAATPALASVTDRYDAVQRENALTTAFQGYRTLHTNYVDVPDPAVVFKGAWERVQASLRDAGVEVNAFAPSDEATFRGAFRIALQASQGKVRPDDLAMAAITGMARSLRDNHTAFIGPQYWNTVQTGRAVQLGFYSVRGSSGLMVFDVVPDMPAARAGLRPGDVILAVNGQSLSNSARVSSAREGVPLTYRVLRGGSETELTLTPETMKQPAVRSRLLPDGVAYLRVYSFFASSQPDAVRDYMRDLDNQLESLQRQSPRGWVVDMRNNPGGNEYLAAYLAARLGLTGPLVENRGRDSVVSQVQANAKSINDGRPVAVLINESSASAAEMVAAALQDARIARVYGIRSPGLVDTSRYYSVGGGALQVTVARAFVGPYKRRLDKVGVTPDETVQLDRIALVRGADPQIDRAVAYVLAGGPALVSAAR